MQPALTLRVSTARGPRGAAEDGRGTPFTFNQSALASALGPQRLRTASRAGPLTSGPQLGGRGAAAEPEPDLAGVDHNAVVGVEVAGADDARGTVAPHQQVVGVGGLAGFHLNAPPLAP